MDQYTFESLHYMTTWWEEAEKNVKVYMPPQRNLMSGGVNQQLTTKQNLTSDCRNELILKYKKLFTLLLNKKLPLSSHEIDDFEQEFTKLYDFYRLALRRGINQFDSFEGALNMYTTAYKHIAQIKPYDKDMQESFQKCLNVSLL